MVHTWILGIFSKTRKKFGKKEKLASETSVLKSEISLSKESLAKFDIPGIYLDLSNKEAPLYYVYGIEGEELQCDLAYVQYCIDDSRERYRQAIQQYLA